jgi:putative transposase
MHSIQRGKTRQICFANEQYFFANIGWLKEFSGKFEVNIHAWVLMTNHVHLLCTPCKENGVSQMMQALVGNMSGIALGNERFKNELASLTGRRLHALPPGRKPGWRKS